MKGIGIMIIKKSLPVRKVNTVNWAFKTEFNRFVKIICRIMQGYEIGGLLFSELNYTGPPSVSLQLYSYCIELFSLSFGSLI